MVLASLSRSIWSWMVLEILNGFQKVRRCLTGQCCSLSVSICMVLASLNRSLWSWIVLESLSGFQKVRILDIWCRWIIIIWQNWSQFCSIQHHSKPFLPFVTICSHMSLFSTNLHLSALLGSNWHHLAPVHTIRNTLVPLVTNRNILNQMAPSCPIQHNLAPIGTIHHHSILKHLAPFLHHLALIHINWHHLAPFHMICYISKKFSLIQWYLVPLCSIKMAKFNLAAICTIWHTIQYHSLSFGAIHYHLVHSMPFCIIQKQLLPFITIC